MADSSITIVGNLTRDPEIRYTPSGAAKASFGVAVSRRWQNRQSQEPGPQRDRLQSPPSYAARTPRAAQEAGRGIQLETEKVRYDQDCEPAGQRRPHYEQRQERAEQADLGQAQDGARDAD